MTAHFRNAEYKNGQNILARNLEGTSKELYSFKLLFFVGNVRANIFLVKIVLLVDFLSLILKKLLRKIETKTTLIALSNANISC